MCNKVRERTSDVDLIYDKPAVVSWTRRSGKAIYYILKMYRRPALYLDFAEGECGGGLVNNTGEESKLFI